MTTVWEVIYVQQGNSNVNGPPGAGKQCDKGGKSRERGDKDVRSNINQWVDVEPKPITERNYGTLMESGKNILMEEQTAVRRLKAWKEFEKFMHREMISVISPEVIVSFIAEKVFVNKASTGIIEANARELMRR